MKLSICNGKPERGTFCNALVSWRFKITTGARCSGVISSKSYRSPDLAYRAGERMMERLKKDA